MVIYKLSEEYCEGFQIEKDSNIDGLKTRSAEECVSGLIKLRIFNEKGDNRIWVMYLALILIQASKYEGNDAIYRAVALKNMHEKVEKLNIKID